MDEMRERYIRHQEGRRVLFLIPLDIRSDDGREAFLSFTELARNSINRDRRRNYGEEDGPNFAQALQKALEYADYVNENAKPHNLHKFTVSSVPFTCFYAGPPPKK